MIEALTYRPGIAHAVPPAPVDLSVLPPFFNELLDEFPWWDRAWRVSEVQPGRRRAHPPSTEVSLPGTVGRDTGETLPFSARVRFSQDRLTWFQAKVDHVVIGPARAAAGEPEPHPFGAVFAALMDRRGISEDQMARRSFLARSTIRMLRHGIWNPHRDQVAALAVALDMPEQDLLAIAGLS